MTAAFPISVATIEDRVHLRVVEKGVDIESYLARIGVAVEPSADTSFLHRVHLAHRERMLFENLDVYAGMPISLELGALQQKLVDRRRGGYCFEHNTLFGAMLRSAGFRVTPLLARVRRGSPEEWVRTHMLLRVECGPSLWLADVGYGALGLLEPIPFEYGCSVEQGGLRYSLRREGIHSVLSVRTADGVSDLYDFVDDTPTKADLEVANHFTSTHPRSVFRKTVTVQRATRDERTILRGNVLTRYRSGIKTEQRLYGNELLDAAWIEFGVLLPDPGFD